MRKHAKFSSVNYASVLVTFYCFAHCFLQKCVMNGLQVLKAYQVFEYEIQDLRAIIPSVLFLETPPARNSPPSFSIADPTLTTLTPTTHRLQRQQSTSECSCCAVSCAKNPRFSSYGPRSQLWCDCRRRQYVKEVRKDGRKTCAVFKYLSWLHFSNGSLLNNIKSKYRIIYFGYLSICFSQYA